MKYLVTYWANHKLDRDVIGYDSNIKSLAEISMFETMLKYRHDEIELEEEVIIVMYEELG